jgi:hypothetical protein
MPPRSSVSLVNPVRPTEHTQGERPGALVAARGLEDALEVADGVVGPDVLAVPSVDGQQGLLEQGWQ